MPNPDPYLRPGLTPATDVELYASEALGGTTTNVSAEATAIGTAAVALVVSYVRNPSVTAIGVAAESHVFTPAPPPQSYERSFIVSAQGEAAEAHEFIPGGTAPSLGNVIGTYYVQPPDFRPEVLRARRCRCVDGVASIACALHCHLVVTRQHVEDELLVLALV